MYLFLWVLNSAIIIFARVVLPFNFLNTFSYVYCLHNQVDCLLIFTIFFKIVTLIRCRLDGCTWKCYTFSSVELLCCFCAWKGLSFITVSPPSSPVSTGLLKIHLKLVLKYSRK